VYQALIQAAAAQQKQDFSQDGAIAAKAVLVVPLTV
jgi:hypothetical protein